jgi:hypothetical protein
MPATRSPRRWGSASSSATTRKPRLRKPEKLASACPRLPMPTMTTGQSWVTPISRAIW